MLERYAIINEAGNWLENIIVLEESDAIGWVPEEGMIPNLSGIIENGASRNHSQKLS